MSKSGRKVVLIGTGMVGMSFAYAALNQNVCSELVLCDINEQKAIGEAQDLNHGLAFSNSSMRIYQSGYEACEDAEIVVICAGVNQKPNESRLELLQRNVKVFQSIIEPVVKSGFDGIFLVATNPVDIMTSVTCSLSGFEPTRVIGTGTTLDTARLRYLLGSYFEVSPKNVHAYVIGEHGDSEFTPWSQALVSTKPVLDIVEDNANLYNLDRLNEISENVKNAAQEIIAAKGATYYGIGMATARIVRAILSDENSILTTSVLLEGEYGQNDVFVGNPCIINHSGISRKVELSLTDNELEKLNNSCNILRKSLNSL
ncbi:MAG: L-lactate dehydrogenase [Ruminococcus sp.]|nr:L-lactate dehydrogenase [Ruminococcus sp.]